MVGSVSGLDRVASLTGTASWSGLVGVGTLCKVFAITVVLTLALASVALADQVTNRIDDTSDTNLENVALNEGGTQTVDFRVHVQGNDLDNGCNIDPGEQLTVQVISSATSVATVNPQTLTFTDCNQNKSVTLTALSRGTSTITVAQDPGLGSNTTGLGTYDYTPASFTVTVNSAPTISDIPDQTTDEDTPTADVPFTIGDVETPPNDLTLTGSSSNTTLVPDANITFGGSGANRTVNITPAANQTGTVTITVGVSDGAATTTDTFVLTINAVNDAPNVASVTNSGPVNEGSQATITVTASDVESNPLLYEFDCNDDGTYEVGPQAGNSTQCTFDDDGTRRVDVRVTDGNGGSTAGFTNVTVNNVAPNAVNDSASALEGGSNVAIDVLANDTDVSGDTLTVTGNTQPPAGEGSVNCSASDCTFTPNNNFNGPTSFTYTISDGDGGTDTATVSITVDPVNDTPTISDIDDEAIQKDTSTGPIPFTIGDVETPAGELTLSGNSSDQALVPDANIVFGGSGENRTLTVTPAAGKTGTATITVGVSDGILQAADSFVITVQDTIAPTVTNVTPIGKKVSPKAMVTATFSEKMDPTKLTTSTFILKKGTKTVLATVSYDTNTNTATLDPSRNLKRGATYTAMVTTGAEDSAGNALAADKVWKFRVRR